MTHTIWEKNEFTTLPADDQRYLAELRKFFELAVREIFLTMIRYGEINRDKDYIARVIANTKRDESLIVAELLSIMQDVVKRDFADLPRLPVVFSDHEITEIVRAEAESLVVAYRKISSIAGGGNCENRR